VKTEQKTILVVDDASLVRLYYRSILEPAGFQVKEALNGLEALEAVLSTPFDMLVVDVNMPHMDGLTFVATLRQKELPLASIPVLITSTEAAQADFDAARAAGANFYLVKPIAPETLMEFAAMFCGITR
jgi:two-component system, chemotaxis family, chemotaxis protein CheY